MVHTVPTLLGQPWSLLIPGAILSILVGIVLRSFNLWRSLRDWEINGRAFLQSYSDIQNMSNEIAEDNPLASTFNLCVEKWAQSVALPTNLAAQNARNACHTNSTQWLDRIHTDLHYLSSMCALVSDLNVIGLIVNAVLTLGAPDPIPYIASSAIVFGFGVTVVALGRQAWHYFAERLEWWDRRIAGFTQKVLDDLSYSTGNAFKDA